jgi:hypothetical protein
VAIPALACPPPFGAPLPPPAPPAIPVEVDGSIQVDGGGIVISPTGEVTHFAPPRPDPLPMVQSPAAVAHVAELLYGRHVHANAGELGRMASQLTPDLLRHHIQAVAATRAPGPGSETMERDE